jgi:hypothetical protein
MAERLEDSVLKGKSKESSTCSAAPGARIRCS